MQRMLLALETISFVCGFELVFDPLNYNVLSALRICWIDYFFACYFYKSSAGDFIFSIHFHLSNRIHTFLWYCGIVHKNCFRGSWNKGLVELSSLNNGTVLRIRVLKLFWRASNLMRKCYLICSYWWNYFKFVLTNNWSISLNNPFLHWTSASIKLKKKMLICWCILYYSQFCIALKTILFSLNLWHETISK